MLGRLNNAIRNQRISRAFGIDALSEVLDTYLPQAQVNEVRKAYQFGAERHEGQVRKSGEAYIYHPLAVARILAEMHLDHTTLMAAILHDVVEDTDVTLDDVTERFGRDVAALVDGVSKLDRAQFQTKAEVQAESFRKLLLAMTQDIRVILVKLADRLHNMRTLGSMPHAKRRKIARETLDIYAPIAQRLGIHTMRVELEDLGFANLYPNRYGVLERAVAEVSGNRRNLIREVEQTLSKALRDEGIGAAVVGRQKNLYSIYLKMRRKHLRFLDVMDLYGFRLVVKRVDDCYRALGVVHHVYKPIGELFNDFIATPKVNGYQSLHTTLVGPGGIKIEVQIRTRDMHHISESGIAAHWQYKLGSGGAKAPQVRAREWLTGLLEMDHAPGNSLEFLENVKIDLFPDEVYVFTPKGQIRRLPRGATPVDFAYSVHTELGNHCVATRVNHHLAPLSIQLRNGDTVEIIGARHARPNAAWLNFVKTAKARTSIRTYLKNLRDDEAVRLGRRLLERSLDELGLSARVLKGDSAERVMQAFELEDMEDLYASIGLGRRLAPLVARLFLKPDQQGGTPIEVAAPLAIQGTEGLIVEYGGCCHPIPGDPIRGHVSMGRGIVIHRVDCKSGIQQRKAAQHDWVSLSWASDVEGDFNVELRVQGPNQRGFLATVATEIAEAGSSIENVNMSDRSSGMADMRINIMVRDRIHLAQVMRALRRLDIVERVQRI